MKQVVRCAWVPEGNELYTRYHDEEWGVPVHDDKKIFEFLVLESAQAGLSWITILKKRVAYKKAFANFDYKKVARFSHKDVARLMNDVGIVRNKMKIEAAINNAKCFIDIQKEFGSFSAYMWQFVGGIPIDGRRTSIKMLPAITKESEVFAKDLKQRGFKFLGATTVYAHMQAVGMVNDHTTNCFRYRAIKRGKRV
jgi:DNA-3-methyladenine glycosylase I